jgi:GH15 family glucan-1,4-alpha-glucosidase
MPCRIEDYGLIGNTRTAALVGGDGSIDWLCVPRFDSPACFAKLLGGIENGRWLIAPDAEIKRTGRRYRGDTLVLETEFELGGGDRAAVIDFMPMPSPDDSRGVELVRIVEGRSGRVPMKTEAVFRFDYGQLVPWVRHRDYGMSAIAGPDALELRTRVSLHGEDFRTRASFTVGAGESVTFLLSWHPSHEPATDFPPPHVLLERTEEWWKEWSARCAIKGKWREAALRSLITLKALTYAPTGGIVAAPTTSLPEKLGGVRNWDYRFCWLRDSTFTLYALTTGGYVDEALAWREWLKRAVAGVPDQLQIMYGIAGERRLSESELPWLSGYEKSVPVRIGNAAHNQFQLDVYGEVLDTFEAGRCHHGQEDEDAWRIQTLLIEAVEKRWREPDEGIWEVRGGRRHFTHSKVLAWVAADRMVKAAKNHGLECDVARWQALRRAIHADVCKRGFDERQNAFVQSYGSEDLDAALLLIPLVGFLRPDDPRVVGTMEAIRRKLDFKGLIRRYIQHGRDVDGLPAGEGAFLPCTFWLVDNLVLMGRHEEAQKLFKHLLATRNDLGLLAEEFDPVENRQLGNFPQAFSHVALVNSAQNLSIHGGPAHHRASHDPAFRRKVNGQSR